MDGLNRIQQLFSTLNGTFYPTADISEIWFSRDYTENREAPYEKDYCDLVAIYNVNRDWRAVQFVQRHASLRIHPTWTEGDLYTITYVSTGKQPDHVFRMHRTYIEGVPNRIQSIDVISFCKEIGVRFKLIDENGWEIKDIPILTS